MNVQTADVGAGLKDTLVGADADATCRVVELSAGSVNDAGCIGTATPLLRWRLDTQRAGVRQLGYRLQVARDEAFTESNVFEAARSDGPASWIWPDTPLVSRETRWVRVRVLTDKGLTDWSTPLRIEAALLRAEDWLARPISPIANFDQRDPAPVPILRKTFVIDRPVTYARLYVTAHGIQESFLNQTIVSDAKLEPGWTAYQERNVYSAWDVTKLLVEGENVLAAAVGDGWWRGWLTWMERRAVYGSTTAYMAQLEIRFADGTSQVVATDGSWRGSTGAFRRADIYDGVIWDGRMEPLGWTGRGFDDRNWNEVKALPLPPGLELRSMPPVRVVQRWSVLPKKVAPDKWTVDTGQNLAGYLRVRVSGGRDDVITVRHAEMLEPNGDLHTAALRNAKATDAFVLAEVGSVFLEPQFTFHGFRYAEISTTGGAKVEAVEVCALSTDMRQIGDFACSDGRLNQLYENVRWSQIGNFVALPTDCPQRDERLGWTGDIQVFSDTACMNADAVPMLSSWLRDLAIEQRADGNVPSTVPNVIQGHEFEYGGVGWGDAATLVPWSLYLASSDPSVLEAQFPSMRRWVDYGLSRRDADGVWSGDFHLGDWLDPGAPSDQPEKATTASGFIASAYLSRSAAVIAATARVLGDEAAAASYQEAAADVAAATWTRWRDHLVTTQAGCSIALQFNIVPSENVAEVGSRLAALVDGSDGRIATGFLGTPAVLPALTAAGQIDAAYRLLLNEACPGWLYQVKHGATTMWERWDAVGEDGALHAGAMTSGEGSSMISFNHYAYGAVALWLYQTVAGIGIDPDRPGYASVRFRPWPGGGLTWARASVDTPFGPCGIRWSLKSDDVLDVDLHIAPGAQGSFEAPRGWRLIGDPGTLGDVGLNSGRHRLLLRRV